MLDEEKGVQPEEKGSDEVQATVLETVDEVGSVEDYAKERAAVSSAYETKSRLSTRPFLSNHSLY